MAGFATWFTGDSLFWFCALAGSGIFIIQFLLSLFGFFHDHDLDDGHDTDGEFKWLSKQTLTGFLMLFGWVGLTCKKEFHFPIPLTILCAFVGGLVALFITAYIFRWARKLHSPGTIFRIEDTIGKEATIYQEIPAGGRGKVSVSVNAFTHEIEAISQLDQVLTSFSSVQIINKLDEKTVIVVPTQGTS